jgi:hypothetical protein
MIVSFLLIGGRRTGEKGALSAVKAPCRTPATVAVGFLRRGLLALRLELLHRLGEGGLQAFRERWGTEPDGGEWLQERCAFRFWPLQALPFCV